MIIFVLIELNILSLQHVPCSAHRPDQLSFMPPVYLVPDAVNEDIDDIAVKIEVLVIKMLRQGRPA